VTINFSTIFSFSLVEHKLKQPSSLKDLYHYFVDVDEFSNIHYSCNNINISAIFFFSPVEHKLKLPSPLKLSLSLEFQPLASTTCLKSLISVLSAPRRHTRIWRHHMADSMSIFSPPATDNIVSVCPTATSSFRHPRKSTNFCTGSLVPISANAVRHQQSPKINLTPAI
jgi:hypothetical protein